LTSELSVKALTDVANKAVEKEGRVVVLVNTVGDKVNVVVASSSKHNAGEICKKLCALLGGGGGGKPTLAMGGGASEGAAEILDGFEVGG